MSGDGTRALTFGDEHVDAILDGEKTVTYRYDLEEDFEVGDLIELRNQNDHTVTEARVVTQFQMRAWGLASIDCSGHASYLTVDELLDELSGYYPNTTLNPQTLLDVVVFATPQCLGPGGDD